MYIIAGLGNPSKEYEYTRHNAGFDAVDRLASKLGTELHWNRGDDIKSSKVFIQLDNVSIENEDDWPQMAKTTSERAESKFATQQR